VNETTLLALFGCGVGSLAVAGNVLLSLRLMRHARDLADWGKSRDMRDVAFTRAVERTAEAVIPAEPGPPAEDGELPHMPPRLRDQSGSPLAPPFSVPS